MRRLAGDAGAVVTLGSAIGEVCWACAGGAALTNGATKMKRINSLNFIIGLIYLVPLIPA